MTRSSWIRLLTAEAPRERSGRSRTVIYPLIKLCAKLLSDDPLFFLISSYTTGLAACRALLYARNCVKRFRWNCPCGGDRASGFRNRSGAPVRRIGTMGKVKCHQKKAAKNDVSSFTAFFFYRSILFMIISTHWSIPNMLLFNTRS